MLRTYYPNDNLKSSFPKCVKQQSKRNRASNAKFRVDVLEKSSTQKCIKLFSKKQSTNLVSTPEIHFLVGMPVNAFSNKALHLLSLVEYFPGLSVPA